ncbi:MbnP family protein [Ferruginibacter sp. SUN002]|uniref:MbnP family protein n=1 Tax=Ferruginibacter sp. SUN002 TaxID=2937789 RepID=UPI003D364776
MRLLSLLFMVIVFASCHKLPSTSANEAPHNIEIFFTNVVRDKPIILGSEQYINQYKEDDVVYEEQYTITKLKYYISNLTFTTTKGKVISEKDSYHLISVAEENTVPKSNRFSFALKSGTYKSVSFLIGVDSIKNISGAQTGALDPLNGMFWTWNSGYIMFKVEGTSPQSKMADNKFEYHIGGFQGLNNTLRRVTFNLSSLEVTENTNTELIFEADLRKFWENGKSFKISEIPICTSEGIEAKKIADNFSQIFSCTKIIHSIYSF